MLELPDYQVDKIPTAVEPTYLRRAIQRWQPDANCIAKGDEFALLMLRCWAAAGLSDQQIVDRILDQLGVTATVDTHQDHCDTAAIMVARHCASIDMTLANIIAVLAHLVVEIPCWPSADEIAAIAQAAVAEFA
jgi:hypothetical protein